MSTNHSRKIKNRSISRIVITALLFLLLLVNARLITDSLLGSQQIDNEIVSEAIPRINKKLVAEVSDFLDQIRNKDKLTSQYPSATVEIKATEPAQLVEITIAIQNASGITGAAAELSNIFRQKGYTITTVSTAPAKENTTTISYKTGNAAVAQSIKSILEEEAWPSKLEMVSEQEADILIILGK